MKSEPVFLCAGQSNMAGRCQARMLPPEVLVQLRQAPTQFTMCWDNDSNFGETCGGKSNGAFLPLQCQEAPGLGGSSYFGPEMGICQTLGARLAQHGVKQAHILKFAMGSTNLSHNWNPDNTDTGMNATNPAKVAQYHRFIEFCRLALQDQPNKELAGLFWLQGESDTGKSKAAKAYLENFGRFVEAVRSDLCAPDLPVIVSPIVWNGKYVDDVNRALRMAGTGIVPNCSCIDEIDETGLESQTIQTEEAGMCAGHLTAEATLDVGRRMGIAFPFNMIN